MILAFKINTKDIKQIEIQILIKKPIIIKKIIKFFFWVFKDFKKIKSVVFIIIIIEDIKTTTPKKKPRKMLIPKIKYNIISTIIKIKKTLNIILQNWFSILPLIGKLDKNNIFLNFLEEKDKNCQKKIFIK